MENQELTTTSKLPSNLLSSQEAMIFNAVNCPKISDLPTDDNLVVVLTMWRNYLGVKEPMTIDEIKMNVSHIKNNYPDFTLEMINLAIKYSFTGVLDVELKPYGTFSPLYISSILNEFKTYSTAVRIKINDKLKKEKEKEAPVVTEEQRKKNRLMYLEYFRDNCTKDVFKDFKGIMWQFLSDNNLVEGIEPDKELIKRESIRKKNQFLDFSIEDIAELEKYSIMAEFFKRNPNFEFNNYNYI